MSLTLNVRWNIEKYLQYRLDKTMPRGIPKQLPYEIQEFKIKTLKIGVHRQNILSSIPTRNIDLKFINEVRECFGRVLTIENIIYQAFSHYLIDVRRTKLRIWVTYLHFYKCKLYQNLLSENYNNCKYFNYRYI